MQETIGIIVAIIAVICFVIWLIWQIKQKGLKNFATDMIILAEETFKKGQNSEKMQYVVNALRNFLKTTKTGMILSFFITDTTLQNFTQAIFDGLKKALDYTPKK